SVASKLGSSSVDASFRRSVRDGVERQQWDDLNSVSGSVTLYASKDRWICDLNGNGVFRVKEINVFAWRVRLDRLPTRNNLVRRGVVLDSSLCPLCGLVPDDIHHFLFRCDTAKLVFHRICRWWDQDWHDLLSFSDWNAWFSAIRLPSRIKLILERVFYIHGSRELSRGVFYAKTTFARTKWLFFWKARFETYVKSKDIDLWQVIQNENFYYKIEDLETKLMKETPYELLEDDQKKNLGKNNEAKMTHYNALPYLEYSSKNHVRKFIRAPPLKWRAKVTAIEEAKDLATLPLDELIGNLKVYEMILENDGVVSKTTTKDKVKTLALKVKVTRDQISADSDSQDRSDEDDEEVDLVMAKIDSVKATEIALGTKELSVLTILFPRVVVFMMKSLSSKVAGAEDDEMSLSIKIHKHKKDFDIDLVKLQQGGKDRLLAPQEALNKSVDVTVTKQNSIYCKVKKLPRVVPPIEAALVS
nr:RNA-directed DNA polymerase, eukaryota [Tanacetum cinerariifolium]